MNLLKHELKVQMKSFLWWVIGLGMLVFVGMAKFQGIRGMDAERMEEMLSLYPKVVLAILGMPDGMNLATMSGYHGVLAYYGMICACVYGMLLGHQVIGREQVNRTCEFLFTKPRSRRTILQWKLVGTMIPLALFCLCYYVFTILSMERMDFIQSMEGGTTIMGEVGLYTMSIFLVALLFYSVAVVCSAVCSRIEQGIMATYMVFFVALFLGGIYDVLEASTAMRVMTPLRYVTYENIRNGSLEVELVILNMVVVVGCMVVAIALFQKKDITL